MALYELNGVGVSTPDDGSYWVAPNAVVVGKVAIETDASVWFGAVLRGDNELIRIGARSNVQDNTVVHAQKNTYPTLIGDNVTIGHSAVVHGCTIRDRVLIGIGAIVLNGAEIGEDTIIAAGALVTERTVVPPRSLVMGRPGKVVRELSDEDVRSIQGYADRYVGYRLDYMIPARG